MKFNELDLPKTIQEALVKLSFKTPTPIQEKAIPVALEGHDILGSAQTGTGKTAAFAIPLLAHLIKNRNSSALILLPTRELAVQVLDAALQMLGHKSDVKSALLIGGGSMMKQLRELKRNPRLIVGTPGRINDHLERKTLKLNNTDFLVLDETDRMLDMGFGIQLEEIVKYLPKERQTLMFSATMPKNIIGLSRKYLNNPVRIAIGDSNAVTQNIKQELIKTSDGTKYADLITQIKTREGSLLVFVKTKFGADKLAKKLNAEKLSADAIHGDLKQSSRDRVIKGFREQQYRILVATDIAARGLDIPHIENVVNYDLPQQPEDYIHRIGRTARAGASGLAINLLTPKDQAKWKEICKLINPGSRDKAMLLDEPAPISAKPLNSPVPSGKNKGKRRNPASKFSAENMYNPYMEEKSEEKKKTKAKQSSSNPFKPFAPNKKEVKEKRRTKFNKNARSFGEFSSNPRTSKPSKPKSRTRK